MPNKYLYTELGFNQKGRNHNVDPNNAWTASNRKRAEDQIQEKNIPSVSGVGEKSSELSGPNCGYCTCLLGLLIVVAFLVEEYGLYGVGFSREHRLSSCGTGT